MHYGMLSVLYVHVAFIHSISIKTVVLVLIYCICCLPTYKQCLLSSYQTLWQSLSCQYTTICNSSWIVETLGCATATELSACCSHTVELNWLLNDLFLYVGWDGVSSWGFRRGEEAYQHWYGADHWAPGAVSGWTNQWTGCIHCRLRSQTAETVCTKYTSTV